MDNQTLGPQPQQPTSPIPPNYEPKTFGWIKWVLIVVVVAILSSTATYFVMQSQSTKQPSKQAAQTPPPSMPTSQPSPDETANWKTYVDLGNKFSLRYPSNWEIIKNTDVVILTPFPSATAWQTPGVVIAVNKDNNERLSVEAYALQKLIPQYKDSISNVQIASKLANVDGIILEGIDINPIFVDLENPTIYIALIAKETKIIELVLYKRGIMNAVLLFNQILSTFQFTQ